MPHDTVVLIIVLVTVAYLASMGILFWRYRKASDQLAQRLRQLRQAKRNQKTKPAPDPADPDTDPEKP